MCIRDRFYTDWYRPDQMAVVIVGDFNKATIEGMIKSHFASIPMPLNARPRPPYDVPDRQGTSYSVITDPEATTTRISVTITMKAREQETCLLYTSPSPRDS